MYYTGTKQECEAYNVIVTEGENYQSSTSRWAEVTGHQNGNDFAILKNSKYESELNEIETLPDDWSADQEV